MAAGARPMPEWRRSADAGASPVRYAREHAGLADSHATCAAAPAASCGHPARMGSEIRRSCRPTLGRSCIGSKTPAPPSWGLLGRPWMGSSDRPAGCRSRRRCWPAKSVRAGSSRPADPDAGGIALDRADPSRSRLPAPDRRRTVLGAPGHATASDLLGTSCCPPRHPRRQPACPPRRGHPADRGGACRRPGPPRALMAGNGDRAFQGLRPIMEAEIRRAETIVRDCLGRGLRAAKAGIAGLRRLSVWQRDLFTSRPRAAGPRDAAALSAVLSAWGGYRLAPPRHLAINHGRISRLLGQGTI